MPQNIIDRVIPDHVTFLVIKKSIKWSRTRSQWFPTANRTFISLDRLHHMTLRRTPTLFWCDQQRHYWSWHHPAYINTTFKSESTLPACRILRSNKKALSKRDETGCDNRIHINNLDIFRPDWFHQSSKSAVRLLKYLRTTPTTKGLVELWAKGTEVNTVAPKIREI